MDDRTSSGKTKPVLQNSSDHSSILVLEMKNSSSSSTNSSDSSGLVRSPVNVVKHNLNILVQPWTTDVRYWLCIISEKNTCTIKNSIKMRIVGKGAVHHGVSIAVIMNSRIMTRGKNVKDERADSSPPSECFPN